MGTLVSHAVHFSEDPGAVRSFYEKAFARKFKAAGDAHRSDCWFITAKTRSIERAGWNVYFATTEFDRVVSRLAPAGVHVVEARNDRFAFVEDDLLGDLVLQDGGGGDALALFVTPDRARALEHIEHAFGLYAERGSEQFATTAAAIVDDRSLRRPVWMPAWPVLRIEAALRRAVGSGAKVVDVRPTWRTSATLEDPWGHRFVVVDERAFDVVDLPDLDTVASAERYVAGAAGRERERAELAASEVARVRERWVDGRDPRADVPARRANARRRTRRAPPGGGR